MLQHCHLSLNRTHASVVLYVLAAAIAGFFIGLICVQVSGSANLQGARRLGEQDDPIMHLGRDLLTRRRRAEGEGKSGKFGKNFAVAEDPMAEPTDTAEEGPCGSGGQPVCAGDQLSGEYLLLCVCVCLQPGQFARCTKYCLQS